MDFPLTSSRFQFKYLGAALALGFFFHLLGLTTLTSVLLCLVIALLASFSYSGVELSNDRARIRNYVDLLGLRIGSWQLLPMVVGVTIKYFSALQASTPVNMSWGTWRTSSRRLEELVVMLSVSNARQGIIIGRVPCAHLQQALADAQQVADAFAVPLNSYLPTHLTN